MDDPNPPPPATRIDIVERDMSLIELGICTIEECPNETLITIAKPPE
jgi:hypothetical protein